MCTLKYLTVETWAIPISIVNKSSFFKKTSAEEAPDKPALLQDGKKDDKQGNQINSFFLLQYI